MDEGEIAERRRCAVAISKIGPCFWKEAKYVSTCHFYVGFPAITILHIVYAFVKVNFKRSVQAFAHIQRFSGAKLMFGNRPAPYIALRLLFHPLESESQDKEVPKLGHVEVKRYYVGAGYLQSSVLQ